MVEAVRLQIFGDVGVDQPQLATLGRSVGLGDLRLAQTQRLDLGAGQDNAGLEGVTSLVIKARATVFSHKAVADPSILVLVVLLRSHEA